MPEFVDECGFAQNFYGNNVCGEKRMDPSKDLFWTQNSRCIGGRGMKRDALCRNLIQKPSLYIYRFGAGCEMSEALKKRFFLPSHFPTYHTYLYLFDKRKSLSHFPQLFSPDARRISAVGLRRVQETLRPAHGSGNETEVKEKVKRKMGLPTAYDRRTDFHTECSGQCRLPGQGNGRHFQKQNKTFRHGETERGKQSKA